MPHRSHTHVVADRAVIAVMSIINECGFAVEVVHHDYGEDLFVQTKVGNQVDPHRIWIQVKGTEDPSRLITKKHGLHLRISEDHAFRWIRSPEMVVVVIWDVNVNKGWWSLPSTNLSEWEIRIEQKTVARLPFDIDALFDKAAMEHLAWRSRIDHYHGLILKAEATNAEAVAHGRPHNNLLPLICFDFLRLLDIIQGEQISNEFMKRFNDSMRRGLPGWNDAKDGPLSGGVLMLLLLARIDDLCKYGLPASILENCGRMLYNIFEGHVDLNTGAFLVKS